MGTRETAITNKIRLALAETSRLFRNHVGMVRDENGRVHTFGLVKGSSDLIGWTEVTVTPEMVGRSVAIFTACEVKSPRGRASEEQRNFIDRVNAQGGIAFLARSADEARSCINDALEGLNDD